MGLILLSVVTMNALLSFSDAMMEADGVTVALVDNSIYSGLYMLTSSLTGGDFAIILSIFTALFVCSDYTNGTLKNIIARGYGRVSIYASKYLVSLVATTIYCVCCWLTGFLSGAAFWGVGTFADGEGISSLVLILFAQLLGAYAYTSLFFLISALFKKTGGSIAVGILGPMILSMGVSLIDAFTQEKSFSVSDYWLDACFLQIGEISVASDILTRCFICFAIYIVVFTISGHLIGSRNEV